MKIWKLISGIISMTLFLFVIFQSCAAGISNSLMENGEISGSAGFMVALFMLAGGIVSVVTRNSSASISNITLIILFGIAAILGFSNYGSYSDLAIWSGWCLINAILALIAIILNKKKRKQENSDMK